MAEAARDAALADFEAELLAMEGEQSEVLAHFRQPFGAPGGITVGVVSCTGPCVSGFAVPGGIAVREDVPSALAAAVRHGVHSVLRSAGMHQAHGWSSGRRGGGWDLRTLAAMLLLFPLTDPRSMALMVLSVCCGVLDPQLRADSRRWHQENQHELCRRHWVSTRLAELRQAGSAAEEEALLRWLH